MRVRQAAAGAGSGKARAFGLISVCGGRWRGDGAAQPTVGNRRGSVPEQAKKMVCANKAIAVVAAGLTVVRVNIALGHCPPDANAFPAYTHRLGNAVPP